MTAADLAAHLRELITRIETDVAEEQRIADRDRGHTITSTILATFVDGRVAGQRSVVTALAALLDEAAPQ